MNTSGKRLRLGVICSYAYSIAQVGVNLIYVPLLLQGLGANEYGLYQLVGAMISYMNIFAVMFQGATTRYYCEYFAKGDKAGMRSVLGGSRRIYRILSIVVGAAGLCCIFGFGVIYRDVLSDFQVIESSAMISLLIINLIIVMNNSVNVSVINAHERFYFIKSLQLATVVAQPILVIVAIRFWPFAIVVTIIQVLLNAFCAVAQRIYAKAVLGSCARMEKGYEHLARDLVRFSSTVVLALIADQVFWKSNQLILGYNFGMITVAVYSIAMQLQMVYMTLGTAIPNVFMPRVSILFHNMHDMRAVSDLFIKVGRLSLFPLLLVLTGFILLGQPFLDLWVGSGYSEAYFIALAILVPLTVDVVQNIGLCILQVVDKYSFRGMTYFFMSLANIVLVVLFAPRYGALGAALCSGVLMLLVNGPIMNVYYEKIIGLDVIAFWKNMIRIMFPIAIYFLVAKSIMDFVGLSVVSWEAFFAVAAVYGMGFCLVSALFSMNAAERGMIFKMLRLAR